MPKKDDGFSAEEKAAMKAAAAERKRSAKGADGQAELLAAIAGFSGTDRTIAEGLHALMEREAPELGAKTWYGMPAWTKGEKVLCYFQNASKFKARYATFGFNGEAALDDGAMWPVTFAITELGEAEQARIAALLNRALGRG